ncbi:hypothetical protein FGO68_gene17466 [Halteria grandinella]|uniref:Uncharacterized protein n=1 Tax=Halteria grandinella TaxID=5974 RepID=A0A8J8P6U2_HALGN|nr:hypothetical protein FGO68_gene17466 [Halteria grandinella]
MSQFLYLIIMCVITIILCDVSLHLLYLLCLDALYTPSQGPSTLVSLLVRYNCTHVYLFEPFMGLFGIPDYLFLLMGICCVGACLQLGLHIVLQLVARAIGVIGGTEDDIFKV